jgi:O-antigen/teichoic acid export membrane protein
MYPSHRRYPALASLGLFFVILGASQWINDVSWGKYSLLLGVVIWLSCVVQVVQRRQSMKAKAVNTVTRWICLSAGA